MTLDKELQNELHKAAGRAIKLLRKDLKPIYDDMGAVKDQVNDMGENIAKMKKDLSEIQDHIQAIKKGLR